MTKIFNFLITIAVFIILSLTVQNSVNAQTCGGYTTSSCNHAVYPINPPTYYSTILGGLLVTCYQHVNGVECGGGYIANNAGYFCNISSAAYGCGACVAALQSCTVTNPYVDDFGDLCYRNYDRQYFHFFASGSCVDSEDFCMNGCTTLCNSGKTCSATCYGLNEPANDCGTAFGYRTCNYTQPQSCTTTSAGTISCSDYYDNCNYAAGYACVGGNTCEKTMGGRVTNAETGAGISGVFISTTRGSDTTDANGYWSVGGFPYASGFTITPSSSGYPCNSGYVCGGTSPTSPNPGSRSGTVGGSGDCGNSCNFTYTPGHIAGHVYIDYNHNGVVDAGDKGISGVTVTATGPTRSDATDVNGAYDIGYLNDGAHTVTVTVPAGYVIVGADSKSVTIGPNNYAIDFLITPLYQISGTTFNDNNLDKNYNNPPDTPFTQKPTIKITGPTTLTLTADPTTGLYNSGQTLLSGQYTVAWTSPLATGYNFTTLSSWIVTVGDRSSPSPVCNTGGSPDATCGNPQNGSISSLNFGLSNENTWIQGGCGGDIRVDSGYSEEIPSTADCNGTSAPYAIMSDASLCPNIQGILFSGNTNPNYGNGTGASTSNIVVGNSLFPELFNYRIPNTSDTSYSFLNTTLANLSTAPIKLTSICPNLTTCTLSKNTPGGVYTTSASDGPVSLSVSNTDGSFDLGTTNYTFNIGGDLTFKTKLTLQNGYSAAFTSGGNIHAASGVGETNWTSLSPDLEGFFSADGSFILDTATTATSLCLASGEPIDRKLNIVGSVITGANGGGESIINNRLGCIKNLSCPTATFKIDPVQILHAPGTLKPPYTFWQELNP